MFHYENGILRFFATAEGYVNVTTRGYNYVYNYTDHLGNVRLSYTNDSSFGLQVIEENNYYPFGLKHNGYNNISPPNSVYKYKYNGKEFQDELGLNVYDFGFRNYQPDLGRWMNTDPLGEKYYTTSPYAYTLNNPMFFVDPDGRVIWIYFGTDNKEREKYTYQKDRDYSEMNGFKADAYRALDALYTASNIEIDGKQVNVVQSLMDDERELSLVQDPKILNHREIIEIGQRTIQELLLTMI